MSRKDRSSKLRRERNRAAAGALLAPSALPGRERRFEHLSLGQDPRASLHVEWSGIRIPCEDPEGLEELTELVTSPEDCPQA